MKRGSKDPAGRGAPGDVIIDGQRGVPVTERPDIRPAEGKLGVLLPGFGAVATTFVAGVEAVRRDGGRRSGPR